MYFKNSHDSHQHSLEVLNTLREYDNFLDSLKTIADMGCGAGLDTEWWATLASRDARPQPQNYQVYAVDQTFKEFDTQITDRNPNIKTIEDNFETVTLPTKADLIWAHDSFQFAHDPVKCLANWKRNLNVNGMLIVTIPQTTYVSQNKIIVNNYNQLYNYNILNLIYMLATNGFDCNDAFFYRKLDTPWLYAGVYANNMNPLPVGTTWYELVDRKLINQSLADGINRYGFARIEDLVIRWFDKNYYQVSN